MKIKLSESRATSTKTQPNGEPRAEIREIMQPNLKPEPGHQPNGPHQRTTSNNVNGPCLCCGFDWHR